MSLATSAAMGDDRTSRWLVLASLALNLFFVGAGGALVARHYLAAPSASPAPIDRSVAARMERLAITLPSSDADVLRAEYRAKAMSVDGARETYRKAQDEVRRILRTEPFQGDAMRAAMTEQRAARQVFDQLLQDVIASAAARMSPAGRNKLADWPPGQRSGSDGKGR
jgi:uncharacterized membrane protein